MPAPSGPDLFDPIGIEIGGRERDRLRYDRKVQDHLYSLPAERNAVHADRLRALSRSVEVLPLAHATEATVTGSGAQVGRDVLDVIASNCLDAARALETGVDLTGKPLSTLSGDAQVGRGLLQMVNDMSDRVGLTAMVLDANGVRLLWVALDDIKGVAGHLIG